jgi:DNA-binding MarR family transcriptional regulator
VARLPLPALLSQALVAFTIEFDNEAEHLSAHRTAQSGTTKDGPWLVSQVAWSNALQYITEDGITVDELHQKSLTKTVLLNGLQRWGYVTVSPALPGSDPKGGEGARVVRTTKSGRLAQAVWAPLADVVEDRWRVRFGDVEIGDLRSALQRLVDQFDVDLPQYLPVVSPTQNGKAAPVLTQGDGVCRSDGDPVPLSALLSQVLLAFALDFEQESKLSLTIAANSLRVLTEVGVRVRDLPALTGVSKEANSMAVGFLVRKGCAVIEDDPAATRTKIVRLTDRGLKAVESYHRVMVATEAQWLDRFGPEAIDELTLALGRLVGDPPTTVSPLLEGLVPYPDGWRAKVRRPQTLPHYPMVLHRGGYPDGS